MPHGPRQSERENVTDIETVSEQSIQLFGADKQLLKGLKAMNELSSEMVDLINNAGDIEKLASTLVDVEIAIHQFKMVMDGSTDGRFSELVDIYNAFELSLRDNINVHTRKLIQQQNELGETPQPVWDKGPEPIPFDNEDEVVPGSE